jgi:hypothetical protein
MPFVWQDQLFMVHSVFPQRVFRCGQAAQQSARAPRCSCSGLPWLTFILRAAFANQ